MIYYHFIIFYYQKSKLLGLQLLNTAAFYILAYAKVLMKNAEPFEWLTNFSVLLQKNIYNCWRELEKMKKMGSIPAL